MKNYEWILSIFIVAGWLTFVVWIRRYMSRKVAEANKTEEYERNKARVAVVLYPAIGLVLIGIVSFQWRNLPIGNEPFALSFIGLGIVAILYGLYKWYCLQR